jgi:hypothetical protein
MLLNYRFVKKFPYAATGCLLILLGLISGCTNTALHPSVRNAELWGYGIDPHGSTVTIGKSIIENGAARIAFNRVAQPAPGINTWIELTYQAPKGNLAGIRGVSITYESTAPLVIKFSQRDFGEEGDNTYAHYQTLLPAAKTASTATVILADFARPVWTPATSKDVGLLLENVTAIYLTPDVDSKAGGYAELTVSAIELIY